MGDDRNPRATSHGETMRGTDGERAAYVRGWTECRGVVEMTRSTYVAGGAGHKALTVALDDVYKAEGLRIDPAESTPPDVRLTPRARELLVEAYDRVPGCLVVRQTVSADKGQGFVALPHDDPGDPGGGERSASDGAEALALLVKQGILSLVNTSGKMLPAGFEVRSSWKLTKRGLEVGRVVAAS